MSAFDSFGQNLCADLGGEVERAVRRDETVGERVRDVHDAQRRMQPPGLHGGPRQRFA